MFSSTSLNYPTFEGFGSFCNPLSKHMLFAKAQCPTIYHRMSTLKN